MLGSTSRLQSDNNETESSGTGPLPSLLSAPNWYQSHVIDSNVRFGPTTPLLAYGARSMVQLLSPDLHPVYLLPGHPKRVSAVRWIATGHIVSGCDGGEVNLWAVSQTPRPAPKTLLQTPVPITALAFRGNPDYLFSGDEKGFICVWGSQLEVNKERRYQPFSERIHTMEASNHGEGSELSVYLGVGYKTGTLGVFNVSQHGVLTLMHTLKGHNSDVFRVAWCPRDPTVTYTCLHPIPCPTFNPHNLLFSISRDKTVKCWDAVRNTLLKSLSSPRSLSRESHLNKEQPWSSLVWAKSGLLACSPTGDIGALVVAGELGEVRWEGWGGSYSHDKKVFGMCEGECNSVISVGMDRSIIVWRNGSSQHVAHGLGGFAYGLDISPLCPTRVAVAVGDNMVRVWDPGCHKVQHVWQSVRTKVMTVSWHPYKEGVLAFGTEEGKVGVYDATTGTSHASATFHEKAVYALSWGFVPTKYPEDDLKTGVYSCGGEGSILCHRPKELNKAALNVNAYLAAENRYRSVPPGRTAVDWEFSAKLLAVGCSTGLIEIFRAPNLQQIRVLQYHTRIINKLRWGRNEGRRVSFAEEQDSPQTEEHVELVGQRQEESPTTPQLLLASGSDDNRVCVYELDLKSTDEGSQNPILMAHRSLLGHTARITDIDWNPHDFRFLVSASYDATAQVWNVERGEGVANYRGHLGRLFSVRWSHTALDHVFTGSDEFLVHQWRMSETSHKLPPETNQIFPGNKESERKGGRRKKRGGSKKVALISESKVDVVDNTVDASWRSLAKTTESPVPPPKQQHTVTVSDTAKRKPARGKSLLPISSRQDHAPKEQQGDHILRIARDLYCGSRDHETPPRGRDPTPLTCPVSVSKDITGNDITFSSTSIDLTPSENTSSPSSTDEISIGLYSTPDRLSSLVAAERDHHTTHRHHHQALLLGIWSSDIATTVNTAIISRTVTESVLAVAVYGGLELYNRALECYISQLKSNKDYLTAASYMLLRGDVYEAIDLLLAEGLHREAVTMARLRLNPDDEKIRQIFGGWAMRLETDMQVDAAAKCYLAAQNPEAAVLVLLKRRALASLRRTRTVAMVTKQVHLLPGIDRAIEESQRLEESSMGEEVKVETVGTITDELINGIPGGC